MEASSVVPSLRRKFETTAEFLIGAELVSTRGTTTGMRASATVAYGRDLARCRNVDWVSITDNAGGNPMLSPTALGMPIRDAGTEVVIHLSCKDFNRNGLESEAWRLASDGFHNLLVLTGDSPGAGIAGGAKPVFDIDSVGLLWLLGQMNAGLDVTRPNALKPVRLPATLFYSGCVVTNFKLHENEVVPQLLKLEKKLAAGARWIVNQIGYDARKSSELIAWLRCRGYGSVPLIGNVYLLNPAVAKLFHRQGIPGVVVSDALAALCERQARSPDKGKAFFLEFAAKQLAVYRGLGYRGAYLGGMRSAEEFTAILDIERRFSPNDWPRFALEIRYSRPGEFFMFSEDEATGLADPRKPDQNPARPARVRGARPFNVPYHLSRAAHAAMFTPGRGLWHLGVRLCARAKDPMQGPALLRAIERASKTAMFGCKDCGDC